MLGSNFLKKNFTLASILNLKLIFRLSLSLARKNKTSNCNIPENEVWAGTPAKKIR